MTENRKWVEKPGIDQASTNLGGFAQIIFAQDNSSLDERLTDKFMDWLNKATKFIRNWYTCIIYFFNQFLINFQTRVLISLKRKHKKINRNFHPLYLLQEKIVSEPCLNYCHLTLKVKEISCNACNLQTWMPAWRDKS